MRHYSIFLKSDCVEFLRSVRRPLRQELASFINRLAHEPNLQGDYEDSDDSGRQIEIKVVRKYTVSFWADHAVREVKIVDIRKAD